MASAIEFWAFSTATITANREPVYKAINMGLKVNTLKQLKAECFSCTQCSLCKGDERVNSPHVFGRGNVNAKIMVVGQNPGYNETIQKQPFVGAAGKNFDQFLVDVLGLTRREIYITNTVKCYSPNNRPPLPEEMDACKTFLKREIETVQPKLIVALGNYALQYFTGHAGMTRYHGRIERSEEFSIDVFPMYHPSPLNMNKPEKRKETEEDFRILKAHLEKI